MSRVLAQVTMCKRNRRPPLLYVVSFGTACLGLLLEAQEPVMDGSQNCVFELLNFTVTERYLALSQG